MKHLILPLIFSCQAFAGAPVIDSAAIQTVEHPSTWWLSLTPYTWVTATEGDMGIAGRVVPVDISMKDAIGDLELAFMMGVEGGIDRWVFGLDGIYGAFSDGTELGRGVLVDQVNVDFDQFLSRVHAGYQVLSSETSTLTVFGGARYSYLSTDINFSGAAVPDFGVSGSKSWIDPVIGAQVFWEMNERWSVRAGGDIGGFGVSSDLIWQANVALGYRYNDSILLLVGYRGLGVDYTNEGFLVDTVAHGPALGVTWRF